MRTFEYRLYPNKAQHRLLMACLAESRHLYNEMLETLKAQYESDGTFPGKYHLTAQFKGRGGEHVPATTVQCLADRLSKALKRFLAAKELGMPDVGFPRFKKPNRWHSIHLRQYGKDSYISCGYVADRDVNAAKNILVKARAWPSGTAPDGEPVELRSPQL